MKKLLFILTVIYTINTVKGNQPDSIPNAGFESWVISTWYEWPTGWQTNNTSLLAPTVMSDTSAHSGNLAMLLVYNGALQPHAWCDFHLNSHPINMGAYIKNHLSSNDSLIIAVRIYSNQMVVDSGYNVIYGGINPDYTQVIIPISQNSPVADSCEISFLGGMTFSSLAYVDDLHFDISLGISEENNKGFFFYPNPCTNHIFLKSDHQKFAAGKIEAYDISGKKLIVPMSFDIDKTEDYIVEINTESIAAGIWFVVIQNDEEKYKMMLIKN